MKLLSLFFVGFLFAFFLFLVSPRSTFAVSFHDVDVNENSIHGDLNHSINLTVSFPNVAPNQNLATNSIISVSEDKNDVIAAGTCRLEISECLMRVNVPVNANFIYLIILQQSGQEQWTSQPISTELVNDIVYSVPNEIISSTGFQNPEYMFTQNEGLMAFKSSDSASVTFKINPVGSSPKNIFSLTFTPYYDVSEVPEGVACSAVLNTDQGSFEAEFQPDCGISPGSGDNGHFSFDLPNFVHEVYSVTYTLTSPPGESFPFYIDYFDMNRNAALSNNLKPSVETGGPYTVELGDNIQLNATFVDPEGRSQSASWSFDSDFINNVDGFTPTVVTENAPIGNYPVILIVNDSGPEAQQVRVYTTLTIVEQLNDLPQIQTLNGSTIESEQLYVESGSFVDVDSSSWIGTVNYGEGNDDEPLTLDGFNFELSHQYNTPGEYEVTVKITDEVLATGSSTATVIVEEPNSEQVTLYPIDDTYIKQGGQNENEGGSNIMRLQSSGKNRGLVQFSQEEIEEAIGSSENYTATLQFTITDNGNNWGANGRTIDLHRLVNPWIEGNGFIVGNQPTFRGTGAGATWNCGVDDNTANQTDDCSSSWEMTNSSSWPFITTPSATTTIENYQEGVVEVDITGDIQEFMNGTDNYGWVIKKTDEGANGRVEFGSRESSDTPQLIISFN